MKKNYHVVHSKKMLARAKKIFNVHSRYKIKRYARSYGPSHPKAAIVWSNFEMALRRVFGTVFPVCYWRNLRISSKVCVFFFLKGKYRFSLLFS